MTWNSDEYVSFDLETTGALTEYALQSWRMKKGHASITSIAWFYVEGGVPKTGGDVDPDPFYIAAFLGWCISEGKTLVGWNIQFDVQWLIALGFQGLVDQLRFLDAMLLWRHLEVEPEYDVTRPSKRSYSLKTAVREHLPKYANYEVGIDFHSTDPVERAKLHAYNIQDCYFTLKLAKKFYLALTPRQMQAVWIEAQCLGMVARANCDGLLIDETYAGALSQKLKDVAAAKLASLGPHGVTEKIVRSPMQLSKLIFDQWNLPVLKTNTSVTTGKVSRSTDKEVLHELAFMDPRAKELREYREALNNDAKFAAGIKTSALYCDDGGRTHPQARVFGTYCVPGDVEVLTREGWVRLDAWTQGEIMQVRPDLTMEFLPAQVHTPDVIVDEWVHVPALRCMFTRGHTMPYLAQKTDAWRTQRAEDWLVSGEQKQAPVAGVASLTGVFTPDQMRLFAAVQADGSYVCATYKTTKYAPSLKFTFKKQRKIARIKQLLDACAITHRSYICASYPDRAEITVAMSNVPEWLGPERKLLGPWLLDTTQEGLRAFVDEVVHWDGSPHHDGGIKYVSFIPANCEWVATAAALVGYKASVHADKRTVHISHERAIRSVLPRSNSLVERQMRPYCATTQTGFWLARSQGRIFVTGNSGRFTYSSKQGKGVAEKPVGFPLHQEKQGREFRDVVIAPEGYTYVEFDASGQEFRWMAIASNDMTMLQLCMPGEDPHGFMGSKIIRVSYQDMLRLKEIDKAMKAGRQLGKVANLCASRSSPILTDRGHVAIQDVKLDDLVWDGETFVTHEGVAFSGVLPVMTYQGITATPDHKVLVDGEWVELQHAARNERRIQSARVGWATVRIVGGIVRRFGTAAWRQIRVDGLRLWDAAAHGFGQSHGGKIEGVSRVRHPRATRTHGAPYQPNVGGSHAANASGELVFSLLQFQRWIVSELRSAWDRVSVCLGQRWGRLGQSQPAAHELCGSGHRQDRQHRPLRTGQPSGGYAQSEPAEQAWVQQNTMEGGLDTDYRVGGKSLLADLHNALCGAGAFWRRYSAPRPTSRRGQTQELAGHRSEAPCYDIVNCGPRTRYAINGRIVHNSLQYRTSAKKLRLVARVQYGIPMEMREAYTIHDTYASTYFRVPEYWDRQIMRVSRCGYAETYAGRRVQVNGDWNGSKAWSMGSTAINYPIQGTGADQKYLAMMMIRDYLTTIGARFSFDLHDGIYLLVPDRYVAQAAAHIKNELDNLPYAQSWNFNPPVPLPWDVKTGKSWGSLVPFTP